MYNISSSQRQSFNSTKEKRERKRGGNVETHDGSYASATKIGNDIAQDIKTLLSASPNLKMEISHEETLHESNTEGLNTGEIIIYFLFSIIDLGGSNPTAIKDRITERLITWLEKPLTQCNIEWSFEVMDSSSV
jgi:hypothetical protein